MKKVPSIPENRDVTHAIAQWRLSFSPGLHEEILGWKAIKSAAGKKCSTVFALPFNLDLVNDLGKFTELYNAVCCFREDTVSDTVLSSGLEAIILRFQHYFS